MPKEKIKCFSCRRKFNSSGIIKYKLSLLCRKCFVIESNNDIFERFKGELIVTPKFTQEQP
jgi:hypothetical protein